MQDSATANKDMPGTSYARGAPPRGYLACVLFTAAAAAASAAATLQTVVLNINAGPHREYTVVKSVIELRVEYRMKYSTAGV